MRNQIFAIADKLAEQARNRGRTGEEHANLASFLDLQTRICICINSLVVGVFSITIILFHPVFFSYSPTTDLVTLLPVQTLSLV
jgi:hypothetical protein